jgi:cell division protease FtsH
MNPRVRRIVAFHESGHAIVATVLPGSDPVHKVSIVQRGFGALGYTMQLPTEDRYLMTRAELEAQLAVLLGGRTAELLVFGEYSTGAQNDLLRASDIARAMVTEFGMSEAVGPVNHEGRRRNPFLDAPMGPERGAYAEETARLIDQEVKRLVTEAEARARTILTERRDVLDVLSDRLLEKEVVEGDELRTLLGSTPAITATDL